MTFRKRLIEMGACSEAVDWVGDKTLAEAWATCERADWMLWLVSKIDGSYSPRLRLAACACARTSLKYVPAGEDRPRLAIECAERYARGEATKDELAAARAAAWDAAWDAALAAEASGAAEAAGAAAQAAAWDAAGDAAWTPRLSGLKEMPDMVRQIIPEVRHAKP